MVRLNIYLAALLIIGLFSSTARAEQINVAVASNFLPVMKTIKAKFEAQTEHRITLSSGSSGKLFAQIMHGAPYSLFFSADAQKPAALESRGKIVAGSRMTYAIGRLALWGPGIVEASSAEEALRNNQFNKLALANVRHAPYGLAASEVLTALNLTAASRSKWVMGENIAQAYQYVETGNAQLGFVALAQVYDQKQPLDHRIWVVPSALHSPIQQDRVLLKKAEKSDAAAALLAFMDRSEIRDLIQAYGYDLP